MSSRVRCCANCNAPLRVTAKTCQRCQACVYPANEIAPSTWLPPDVRESMECSLAKETFTDDRLILRLVIILGTGLVGLIVWSVLPADSEWLKYLLLLGVIAFAGVVMVVTSPVVEPIQPNAHRESHGAGLEFRIRYKRGSGAPSKTTPRHGASRRPHEKAAGSVTTGLIIDEPWISKILAGEKRWEMRPKRTTKRERIALIRKGSGTVVGLTSIVDCKGPLDDEEIVKTFREHHVPLDGIGKWRYAWVLDDTTRLETPVPYEHRSGAVTFVTLDPRASFAIDRMHNMDTHA
jgi:hypothetical protein